MGWISGIFEDWNLLSEHDRRTLNEQEQAEKQQEVIRRIQAKIDKLDDSKRGRGVSQDCDH